MIINAVSGVLLVVDLFVSGIANAAHHEEKSVGGESTMHATEAKGVHDMSGATTHIDHRGGMLGLKTGAGDLTLHFPPPAIENLKEGDKIKVHLGYVE